MPEGVDEGGSSITRTASPATARSSTQGFDTSKKTAAVILGQGWAGSHVSIEKYAAAFAKHGLVAMAIDYRGWGNSEGKARVISPVNLGGGMEKDENRHAIVRNATVWIKRTELNAREQQEDYRNAISFIQGRARR